MIEQMRSSYKTTKGLADFYYPNIQQLKTAIVVTEKLILANKSSKKITRHEQKYLPCQKCCRFAHSTEKCRTSVPVCYACNEKGHIADQCPTNRGVVGKEKEDIKIVTTGVDSS